MMWLSVLLVEHRTQQMVGGCIAHAVACFDHWPMQVSLPMYARHYKKHLASLSIMEAAAGSCAGPFTLQGDPGRPCRSTAVQQLRHIVQIRSALLLSTSYQANLSQRQSCK
jgi:hypothetical protein